VVNNFFILYVVRILTLAGFLFSSLSYAQAGNITCGGLANPYGPFDYRNQKQELIIVDGAHFLPFVENLSRGNTAASPGGDIDYTLRASPNHHRALLAMMNLGRKEKTEKPKGSRYTISCWFDRAERFRPDDSMVKVLHGVYLMRSGQTRDAIDKLEEALRLGGEDANLHYNLGLAYFEAKDFDKALSSAHQAYKLGFQLPGLRDKLVRSGKWHEPDVKPAEAEPSSDRQ
jgi:tetratricopeptide (TPR) repeat protein